MTVVNRSYLNHLNKPFQVDSFVVKIKKVEQFLGILVFQRSCNRYFANLGSQREL